MPGNNKLQGMKLLAEKVGVKLSEISYIGDTGGDVAALENVKMPYSPSNATAAVKKVTRNLESETTDAVLEAYQEVIEMNREGIRQS